MQVQTQTPAQIRAHAFEAAMLARISRAAGHTAQAARFADDAAALERLAALAARVAA